MSRYLKGDIDADLATLQKLAELFGHSITALLATPTDPEEAQLIALYRAQSPDGRAIVLSLLNYWSRLGRAREPKSEPRSGR